MGLSKCIHTHVALSPALPPQVRAGGSAKLQPSISLDLSAINTMTGGGGLDEDECSIGLVITLEIRISSGLLNGDKRVVSHGCIPHSLLPLRLGTSSGARCSSSLP